MEEGQTHLQLLYRLSEGLRYNKTRHDLECIEHVWGGHQNYKTTTKHLCKLQGSGAGWQRTGGLVRAKHWDTTRGPSVTSNIHNIPGKGDGRVRGLQNGCQHKGELIDNLRFADDIDLLEERSEDLQESLNGVAAAAEPMGLRLNIAKTKVMVFGEEQMTERVAIGNTEIDCVKEFEYLGSLITWDNDCSREIKRRIAEATGAMAGFNPIWRSKVIRN